MRILLANDDGIAALGIQTLAKALVAAGHAVFVMAPQVERSAYGHAISLVTPLRTEVATTFPAATQVALAVQGTPADCIKLALTEILKEERIDCVISGINHGSNLGGDVIYSGTVAAALEASMNGVRGIATSLVEGQHEGASFERAAAWMALHVEALFALPLPTQTILNINFPCEVKQPQLLGHRLCRLSPRMYSDYYAKCQDPRGGHYYWLAGEALSIGTAADEDVTLVHQGYVSISPLHADLLDVQRHAFLQSHAFFL